MASASSIRTGSSPLVRGKQRVTAIWAPFAGLIPAGAGKTSRMENRNLRHRAHPRWCGENLLYACGGKQHRGSSPLVRGKPTPMVWGGVWAGLIPAGAGKTAARLLVHTVEGAHPRWCGENYGKSRRPRAQQGSSPLVRGKHRQNMPTSMKIRLIPAGAGKTYMVSFMLRSIGAHPRWCGENASSAQS
ncbi:Domain of uncharacterised function (DUF2825) [Corynebacterium diphtheriae]|nr:Domain of uncharacterised function (DUF2825) [Corynebacterium diphtheriae]